MIPPLSVSEALSGTNRGIYLIGQRKDHMDAISYRPIETSNDFLSLR